MRLYMKQKVFSWKDKFTVKDENEEDKYFIEGELISIGKKLHIMDVNGNELAFVRQKVITLLPRFFVEINGETIAEIVKKLSFFTPKYEVNGLGWTIKGDIMNHDYDIEDNGKVIATIHKKWISWGDSFEININDNCDEVTVLAVVLAIDAVLDTQEATNNSNY